jgi:hypothetical protein
MRILARSCGNLMQLLRPRRSRAHDGVRRAVTHLLFIGPGLAGNAGVLGGDVDGKVHPDVSGSHTN